jgi:hypothetical protein
MLAAQEGLCTVESVNCIGCMASMMNMMIMDYKLGRMMEEGGVGVVKPFCFDFANY